MFVAANNQVQVALVMSVQETAKVPMYDGATSGQSGLSEDSLNPLSTEDMVLSQLADLHRPDPGHL